MDWITNDIAIGNYVDAENKELLLKQGIKSVIGLDGKLRGDASDFGVNELEIFNFIDGAGNSLKLLHMAIDVLIDFIANEPPVLVYCHAGRSRSPTIVAGYFIKQKNMSPEDALSLIEKKRSIAVASELRELLYYL